VCRLQVTPNHEWTEFPVAEAEIASFGRKPLEDSSKSGLVTAVVRNKFSKFEKLAAGQGTRVAAASAVVVLAVAAAVDERMAVSS